MMTIPLPDHFQFQATVNSHGWYDLPPFRTNELMSELQTVITLAPSKHAHIAVRQRDAVLTIAQLNQTRLSRTEQERIKNFVRSILRMNEPLDKFYGICKKNPGLRWVPRRGAGRLLRSPTVFEDVVKMLFTTNCSWSLTKSMTLKLTHKLGERINETTYSFPAPEAIAQKSERWIRKEISCGYRAPYLLELCRRMVQKKIDLESLRNSDLPTEELYWTLRSVKGIGHYAAGNVLKLLGRYDYLGIDSWVRKRFSELHHRGRKVSDKTIEKYYEPYGAWRGLVCWMEVTSDWHT